MRITTLQGNKPRRRKWLARLSKSKQDDLMRLEKRAGENTAMREFLGSIDALIPFTGLWPAMQLGTFHRLLTMHWPEVSTVSFTQLFLCSNSCIRNWTVNFNHHLESFEHVHLCGLRNVINLCLSCPQNPHLFFVSSVASVSR